MKIGVDTRPLQHDTRYRGIGKSLEALLLALKKAMRPGDSLCFYVDAGLPKPELLAEFKQARVITVPTSRLGRKRYFRSFMQSFKTIQPKKSDVEVLLQYDASFGVPKNVPAVVIFHDLIPYLFRSQEKQRPVKGARKLKDALARSMYWKKYLRVLESYKDAKKIIAISQSSKKDLLEYLPSLSPADIAVIPHGPDSRPDENEKPTTKIKQLTKTPYLMYAGGVDIRKNIVVLLNTFYELKPAYPELRLVLVGKEFELSDRLEDLGWYQILESNKDYAKDVVITGFISSADLAYLYRHAAAFVLASRYEGFGMPVLEAMSAGTPVVAYDNSSIPEVAGEAALLVKDGETLAPAIEKILNNPGLRKELISLGSRQAKKFSWDKSAASTIQVLKEAARS